jgi:hypothetical protein
MIATDAKKGIRAAAVAGLLAVMSILPAPAAAQAPADPNTGALTFSGAFDVPSLYLFRGIRQESDPALTMWPYADLKIDLMTGDGGLKSAAINVGVWNSLHTGTSGTGGALGGLHYEEDFYSSFTLGFAGATSFTTQFTAYTSPNGRFSTTKEILFKVAQGSKYGPYGLVAFEVGGAGTGQADGGAEKGTYLEFGIGPSWPLGGSATIAVPVKVGLSANSYYECPAGAASICAAGDDSAFGYFDIGGLVTVPISGIASRFGSWNFHFGGDYLALGDTNEAFNVNKDGETSSHKFVGLVGFGVSY